MKSFERRIGLFIRDEKLFKMLKYYSYKTDKTITEVIVQALRELFKSVGVDSDDE